MKNFLLFILLTLFAVANDNNSTQTNPMKLLYFKNACNSCHGIYAEGMGANPRLQGVREALLLRRLKALQKGKTRTAFGGVMISFAKSLNEKQTIAMAKYLSTLKTKIDNDRYDEEYDPAGDGGS